MKWLGKKYFEEGTHIPIGLHWGHIQQHGTLFPIEWYFSLVFVLKKKYWFMPVMVAGSTLLWKKFNHESWISWRWFKYARLDKN